MTRCLIVEDDALIREYLADVVARWGIESVLARDGEEAAVLLRKLDFDALFLDLHLPGVSGEQLLRLIARGGLRKPRAIALVSGATSLAAVADGECAALVSRLIPKPFDATDVRGFLEASLGHVKTAVQPLRESVGIVGQGLWSDAVAQVLVARGGTVARAASLAELAPIVDAKPAAVVVGPPFEERSLLAACAEVRQRCGGATLIAVQRLEDRALAADLLTIGVGRVFHLYQGLGRLSDEALRLVGRPRRVHTRVPVMASVLVREPREVHRGEAFDICEGGIGLENLATAPAAGTVEVEFRLPGSDEPISAASEVAWVRREGEKARAGVRFRSLDASSRQRIRTYIASCPAY